MFIKRLKLVNFIGIKSGTGLDEIEIFFPRNGNIINMFLGENGSGKSTLLSMLTPFKDSFDSNRKSLILSGKEGIKEIDIEANGHEYKIKHIYGKQSFSYISEDGVELNENGGVRTCEEFIFNKLKATKEYYKIAKLGSNTETFINFTTTQRKSYISTFVEAVQKYIDAYEVVNKKAKLNESQIKQISSDLKKLDSVELLTKKINEATTQSKNIEDTIDSSNKEIAKLDVEISSLAKTMAELNYVELKSMLKIKEDSLKKNYKINEKFDTVYKGVDLDVCKNKITELKEQIRLKQEEKNTIDNNLSAINSSLVATDNNIIKTNNQLLGKIAIDLNGLSDSIKELETTKTALENEIDSNVLATLLKKNEQKALVYIDNFKTFMLTLTSYYSTLNECTIIPSKHNVELFFKPDFGSVFSSYTDTIKTTLSTNRNALETSNNEYSVKSANLDKLEILEKRPTECKIDTCPFISNALKYVNLPEEMTNLEAKIEGIKNTIKDNEEQAEKLSDIRIAYSEIYKAFTAMLPRENIIYACFVKLYGKISDVMLKPLNEVEKYYTELVTSAEYYLQKINDLGSTENLLNITKIQYTSSVDSENSRLYFENELVGYQNDKINLTNQRNEEQGKLGIVTNELTKLGSILQDYEDYQVSLTETDSLEKEVEALRNSIQVYETSSKEKNEKFNHRNAVAETLSKSKQLKESLANQITEAKATEITVNNLTDNMAKLQATYEQTDLLKQALSPKSGIPLVFIQSYLDGTEAIANELLNIAYGGKFEIKFMPTASDFFIQVRSGENIIDDILAASQGEVSMTAISISLALIERSLGENNIMYLDEIDGPLDINNREYFIDILNKQIEKLGIEQIFVISHNNAFENCQMNLVLLHGNKDFKSNDIFMSNKEIIYEVSE